MSNECNGNHRFFVSETGTVDTPTERAVFVLIICTACGEFRSHKLDLSGTLGSITLKNQKG
jgi:hypothetical protein